MRAAADVGPDVAPGTAASQAAASPDLHGMYVCGEQGSKRPGPLFFMIRLPLSSARSHFELAIIADPGAMPHQGHHRHYNGAACHHGQAYKSAVILLSLEVPLAHLSPTA